MKKYEVEIKGITPYLMNRFCEADIDTASRKRTGTLKTEEFEKEQLEKKYYRLHNGDIYVPATQIEQSVINAGKELKVVGKGKATYSKLFGASVWIEPDAIVMKNQKHEIFRTSVINPNTRGRMMVSRPRFNEWELEFMLYCEDDQIPGEVLEEALHIAGRRVGIGDWRPQKKGKYGKFMVTKFKEIT